MAPYNPPIDDIAFLLNDVLDFDGQMQTLPGYEEVSAELAVSVLEEGGKFCAACWNP